MRCNICKNEAIFFQSYSGRHLCGRHLALDIEARAKRSIRSYHWMSPEDHIAVVVYGDRKSAALAYFLKKLIAGRRDIRLSVLPCCGMVPGDRDGSAALKVAESLLIPCIKMPEPGRSGDAGESTITKIAVAVSLDNIAQGVLCQLLFSNADRLVNPPPLRWDGIPVIFPFITIPSDELDHYWEFQGAGIHLPSGTFCQDACLQETASMLGEFSKRHPATKYAILHLAEQLGCGGACATPMGGFPGPGAGGNSTPQKKTEQLKNSVLPL